MTYSNNISKLAEEIRLRKKTRFRSAGRLMSLAEESSERTIEILRELSFDPLPRIILGITGAPGSGKSLLANRMISNFREEYPEKMIGAIAVDPSSSLSGGSILGDRIRMMQHADDSNVFIRSIASHGQTGGITLGTMGIVSVMGLLGCDIVLIETVGVGQMEFAVKDVSDIVAIVMAPGQGDTMQFLKAGLMEVGDMFIINKSDCLDSIPFHAQLKNVLHLLGRETKNLVRVSARDNLGLQELFSVVEDFFTRNQSEWKISRKERLQLLVKRAVFFEVQKRLEIVFEQRDKTLSKKILEGKIPLSLFVDSLIEKLK
ncbi:MAG: methylmalonyl Co-A mutase-associated GTPase MeaB [Candidatus Parcubacteria bacterium]|nr:methylmalonyl Co-A mutase-associated GTPase MeaB [Candidatus Parcubacteria bacterium]